MDEIQDLEHERIENKKSGNKSGLLAGLGLGAALMYLLDPGRGGRRRAQFRDKFIRGFRVGRREVISHAADIRNRAMGTLAEVKASASEPPNDKKLEQRVRSELGHHLEHARAIEVVAEEGTVTLRGPVPQRELGDAIATAKSTRGVKDVHDEMAVQESPLGADQPPPTPHSNR